ncbi:MAG: hypothetical protein LBB82_03805 [Treponema sp.]|jgi:hypothetical protein|nr:hypothetical protein [Treponema sp.]
MRSENFVDRRLYSVFTLELPSLSGRARVRAAREELARWYPESIDAKTLVMAKNGRAGHWLALVFETNFEADRKNDPLSLSTLAALKIAAGSGKAAGEMALVTEKWIEYLAFDSGSLTFSAVRERKACPPEVQLEKDIVDMFGAAETPVYVLAGDNLERVLSPLKRSDVSCYPAAIPSYRRKRLAAVFAAAVLLAAAIIFGAGLAEQKHLVSEAARRERFEREELARKEAEQLETLAALENEYSAAAAQRFAPVYRCLQVLASSFNGGIRIVTAEFREGNFRVEGEGINSLAALENLERNPQIADVTPHTVLWTRGEERFSLSGTVLAPPVPRPAALTAGEKIIWYGDELRRLRTARKENGSAGAAAETARTLLETNGCRVKSIRFLQEHSAASDGRPSADAGKLECGFTAQPYALVAVLAALEHDGLSPSAVSLSTRRSADGIDAVLILDGLESKTEHGGVYVPREAPSDARIAALYQTPVQRARAAGGPAQNNFVFKAEPASNDPLPQSGDYLGFIEIGDSPRITYVKDSNGKVRRADEN